MSAEHDPSESPTLDARLVCWLASQVVQDRYARLVDGGADLDERIELASLFIDLPASANYRATSPEDPRKRFVQAPTDAQAMPLLLHGPPPEAELAERCAGRGRWLLVGGPGSGKSTITTMLAQQLRAPWVEGRQQELTVELREAWAHANESLTKLAADETWGDVPRALPLRVTLPALADWITGRRDADELSLWDYLAYRIVEDLDVHEIRSELTARSLRELVEAAPRVVWILDGLDEVPASAGRAQTIEFVRATICAAAHSDDGVLVSTRPQGYDGEFDDLDELELVPLPATLASRYAERLLQAWHGHKPAELAALRAKMKSEFAKVEVAELLHTPLHTTMAALLLAKRGSLPKARSKLFEHYFNTILARELRKPLEVGVRQEDEGIIRALHKRAGITLQARSQAPRGARSSLRQRELRELLAALFGELGYDEEDARGHVERIMHFAAERLVLLLHAAQGEYEFGVRSLQEFFAAEALLEGEPALVRGRLEAIAVHPHWSNVLAFVISDQALVTDPAKRGAALDATVGLCRSLNAGKVGGLAAARCSMGSRLAMHMLAETEHYGHPWLHEPLWEVALEAGAAPSQQVVAQLADEHNGRSTWADTVEIHTRLGRLAGRWAASKGDKHRRRVLELAEEALAGDAEQIERGWRLLHGLLLVELPEALALAQANAPRDRDAARELVSFLSANHSVPAPSWVGRFVDRHPEWFLAQHQIEGLPKSLVSELLNRIEVGQCQPIVLRLSCTGENIVFPLHLRTVDALPFEEFEALIPDEPAWTRWRQLAGFVSAPSPLSLAVLLEGLDTEDALEDLRSLAYSLPWPAFACLHNASSLAQLSSLSEKLRDGRLGTYEDWRAAEARWRESPQISPDDVLQWLDVDRLWSRDIASRGVPFIGAIWGMWVHFLEQPFASELLERLLARVAQTGQPSSEDLVFLDELAGARVVVPMHALRLLEPDPRSAWLLPGLTSLSAGLRGPERQEWLSWLEQRGRIGEASVHPFFFSWAEAGDARELVDMLIEHMREHPEQCGLLATLLALVTPRTNFSQLHLPTLPEDAPSHATAARAYLQLLSGRFDPEVLPELLAQLGDRLHPLARVLPQSTLDGATIRKILLTALDTLPLTGPAEPRETILGALYEHLRRARPPAFLSAEAWQSAGFPPPYLELSPRPVAPPRLVRLIELSNLRLFKTTPTIDVPFPNPPADRGQWIVLIGENGVGKTTLLRALALTLASPPVASKLLDERLPMIRNGGEARISIELDTGTLAISLSRGERTEHVESRSPEHDRPWVVGYGVRRGNARGERDRDAELGAVAELHTLFDRGSLHNAGQWLAKLDANVLREQRRGSRDTPGPPGPYEQLWRAVQRALEVLLDIAKVEVDQDGLVYIQHRQFGRVRLDALSDGYLTTAGWVIDMIARWVERQDELDEPIGADLLRQMCGFVLIDEIDLHLHPMWQLKIIEDIRHLFPRLSFVVTTHNPLTLQGARRGEVYSIRRDGGAIELVQQDIRPGEDVDRVLLDQFGVAHTFDSETRGLLNRHRELVEGGVAAADPERAKLEGQLRERLGDVGETLVNEREAAHGPVTPLTPEERARFLARDRKKKA